MPVITPTNYHALIVLLGFGVILLGDVYMKLSKKTYWLSLPREPFSSLCDFFNILSGLREKIYPFIKDLMLS
jgi:hypothetical protein